MSAFHYRGIISHSVPQGHSLPHKGTFCPRAAPVPLGQGGQLPPCFRRPCLGREEVVWM